MVDGVLDPRLPAGAFPTPPGVHETALQRLARFLGPPEVEQELASSWALDATGEVCSKRVHGRPMSW
jgi:hypothetical protein